MELRNHEVALTTVPPEPITLFMVQEHELTSIQERAHGEQLWSGVCTFSWGLAIPTGLSLGQATGAWLSAAWGVATAAVIIGIVAGLKWKMEHQVVKACIKSIKARSQPTAPPIAGHP